MALADLATTSDLSNRGVTPDATLAGVMLSVASSLVREAARSPISETTSTVTVWAIDETQWLDLPGKPVTAVSAVTVDGVALDSTVYKLIDGRLWRAEPWAWGEPFDPVEVQVTMTHGLATVPPHIVQLVCDLAILGVNSATEGARDPRAIMERIDDYSVQWAAGADAISSAMVLPRAVRQALAAQFGGGVGMVAHR